MASGRGRRRTRTRCAQADTEPLLTCCAAAPGRALPSAFTIYDAGEAVSTMEDGKISRHAYVIARTSDPEKNEIRELAVAFDPRTGKYAEHATTITVKGNKLSMKGTDFKIDDVNLLAEYETSVQGHKDFYRSGKRFIQEDVVLHAVDKATSHLVGPDQCASEEVTAGSAFVESPGQVHLVTNAGHGVAVIWWATIFPESDGVVRFSREFRAGGVYPANAPNCN